ncbi:MAG: DUF1080 domain-containing protein [Verrucomicrobia bacterium]|nr:DUF1080 domain-containing protein [Verrucomicrobiota bacterium]MBI3870222.1 DUF1080 domain-containing protein [Verrucomicrobiota bacterium]
MKAILCALALAAVSVSVFAAEEKPTYLTPAAGGADYASQGEYKNDWGGAQVIALGNDEFRMVTYPGGLPGAGWNQETRTQIPGKRVEKKVALTGDNGFKAELVDDKIVFTGENGYKAELAGGKITIHTATGGPYTMEKIERKSPTLGEKPPAGAVVLFDGSTADGWQGGHLDDRKLLAAGCKSKQAFGNFTAHFEFLLPFKPLGRGQDRGNSGVYLQDRYELQVLDSFGLKGENNECGGFYQQAAPKVNMCFPPLTWQTYDIDFTAATYDASGAKTKSARVTVKHNGVLIHENFEFKGCTAGNGRKEDATDGPFMLQGHGNPVFYQNIWVVAK